ncbi:alpha/beta hydrolase [Crenobacter sp. SG2305]|uniref:alpha/beta hydrolase n=1 Tax=Crenobacter oryzisoli TaxID=3056844 RepID=UPI0025AA4968|nr:alpha/beta hydrolase [Crenobacter sp. SG2305]MDN0084086.1 alpha/beta hydrolase [Crenobacter sp. SG2305]
MAHYPLSEAMQEFVHTSGTFTGADDSIDSGRAAYDALCRYFTPVRTGNPGVEDLVLAAPGRDIPLRVYRPLGEAPAQGWPSVLYLHGGGWVVGGLDSHEFVAAPLACDTQSVVVVVDYRLAPEHVFPAAFDDCLAAWHYLQAHGDALGINPANVVVAGDSAGGNLAAALCLAVASSGGPAPVGQALIYPGLGTDHSLPSYRDNADAPLLTSADVEYYLKLYAPDPATHDDPRLSPLSAKSLAGLPPAFVAVAEFDPLRDDGQLYVERLRGDGVDAQYHLGRGLLHGCLRALHRCSETARLYRAFAEAVSAMQVQGKGKAG